MSEDLSKIAEALKTEAHNLELAKKRIKNFLIDDDSHVFSIKGSWGGGKTFLWHDTLAEAKGSILKEGVYKRYSYVSLFGSNSIQELESKRIENSFPIKDLPPENILLDKTGLDRLNQSYLTRTLGVFLRACINKVRAFFVNPSTIEFGVLLISASLPLGYLICWLYALDFSLWDLWSYRTLIIGGLIAALSAIAKYPSTVDKLSNTVGSLFFDKQLLVCIDDFERRGKGLTVNSLLGYITKLTLEKNCKVVLILNEEQLTGDSAAEYATYREKVIDWEVTFSVGLETAIRHGLKRDAPYSDILAEKCRSLKIENIRVLKKIQKAFDELSSDTSRISDELKKQIAASLAAFAYIQFVLIGKRVYSYRELEGIHLDYATSRIDKEYAETMHEDKALFLLFKQEPHIVFDEISEFLFKHFKNGQLDKEEFLLRLAKLEFAARQRLAEGTVYLSQREIEGNFLISKEKALDNLEALLIHKAIVQFIGKECLASAIDCFTRDRRLLNIQGQITEAGEGKIRGILQKVAEQNPRDGGDSFMTVDRFIAKVVDRYDSDRKGRLPSIYVDFFDSYCCYNPQADRQRIAENHPYSLNQLTRVLTEDKTHIVLYINYILNMSINDFMQLIREKLAGNMIALGNLVEHLVYLTTQEAADPKEQTASTKARQLLDLIIALHPIDNLERMVIVKQALPFTHGIAGEK